MKHRFAIARPGYPFQVTGNITEAEALEQFAEAEADQRARRVTNRELKPVRMYVEGPRQSEDPASNWYNFAENPTGQPGDRIVQKRDSRWLVFG